VTGRKKVKTYKQSTVNAIILVLILSLFVYFAVQLSSGFSDTVSTQRTQRVTEAEYSYFTGYIFKDETVIDTGRAGVADYLVSDGEKVGNNQAYADLYPSDELSDEKREELQASLNDINSRLERLDGGVGVGGVVADLSHVNESLSRSYYSYVDALLDGELEAAEANGEILLGALVDYSVITGRDGVAQSALSSLTEQKNELLTSLGTAPQTLVSSESCYFYYETDGFESIFNSSRLESLTPAALGELIESDAEQYGTGVIGKTIYDPKWQLVIPTNAEDCLDFKESRGYTVSFSDNDSISIEMVLEKIAIDESGEAYLLFSSYDLSAIQGFSRAQSVKVLMSSISGYRIPSESLKSIDGEDGVYILIGTEVAFRRVTLVGECNGYYIVRTYEEDAEEQTKIEEDGGEISDIPYLNANDLIITSGNDLYDGKHIN